MDRFKNKKVAEEEIEKIKRIRARHDNPDAGLGRRHNDLSKCQDMFLLKTRKIDG